LGLNPNLRPNFTSHIVKIKFGLKFGLIDPSLAQILDFRLLT